MRLFRLALAVWLGGACGIGFATEEEEAFTELEAHAWVLALGELREESVDPAFLEAGGWLDGVKDRIEQVREIVRLVVDSYDENGNGKIDPGPEWDAFVDSIEEFAMIYLDKNGNGHIDHQDVIALIKELTGQAKGQLTQVICQADVLGLLSGTKWYQENCL